VERCWVLFGCYLGESRATVSCSLERESKRERGTSVADRSLFLLSQGLVCITPASGFVGAPAAVAFGFVGGVVCNFATRIKVRENPSTRVEEKARRARRADLYPFLRQFLIHVDDVLDILATHGVRTTSHALPLESLKVTLSSSQVGGIAGNLLTALFAQASIASLDGFSVIDGGWIDHHYIQVSRRLLQQKEVRGTDLRHDATSR